MILFEWWKLKLEKRRSRSEKYFDQHEIIIATSNASSKWKALKLNNLSKALNEWERKGERERKLIGSKLKEEKIKIKIVKWFNNRSTKLAKREVEEKKVI